MLVYRVLECQLGKLDGFCFIGFCLIRLWIFSQVCSCHRLGTRENCPHLGSLIALLSRLHLAPTPSPLVLVQRVIVTYSFCLGTGLDISRCLVSGRRQRALGLRHRSRQRRHCTLYGLPSAPPTVLRHGFVMDYVSGILDSFWYLQTP